MLDVVRAENQFADSEADSVKEVWDLPDGLSDPKRHDAIGHQAVVGVNPGGEPGWPSWRVERALAYT